MHARIATYTYTGDAIDIARQAEDGMLPIFQGQPGFKGYSLIDTGDTVISITEWDSAESAERANVVSSEWVEANIADRVELKKAHIGELLLSTPLRVSTKAHAAV
jgi:heme-degrading monooxygenase HmoA